MRKTLGDGVSMRHRGGGHVFSDLDRWLLSHGETTPPALSFMVIEKPCDLRQWPVRFGRRRSGGKKVDKCNVYLEKSCKLLGNPHAPFLQEAVCAGLPHPVLPGPPSPQHPSTHCVMCVYLPFWRADSLVWGHGCLLSRHSGQSHPF